MKLTLEGDLQQQMIAVAVLEMLERGEKVHDIAEVTQEIVKQVWYGYRAEQRGDYK
ncbi:hypothetical protein P4S93_09635 [Aneurinibacillus thermoaerophilus]|uniref:hypothetical protein n=1 Tax=Aneurinibacillus thermoaerophilus TaxID=143495 RepID=UPI002E1D3F05|nr:hypothetical protein [Aneurinibacillus thermoaerophilus]MED0761039.1 hypothetical protein [Aneurinibacillus thermoaerophilus]